MATANSIALPMVMSPPSATGTVPVKMILLNKKVRRKSAVMTTTLILPRFLSPNKIHTPMRAPMTMLHGVLPISMIVLAAIAALAIMTAVQPISWITLSPAKNLEPS